MRTMSRPNAAPPEEEHGSCRQYSERGCYHGPVPARRANGLAGASGGSWGGGAGGGGGGGQVHRGLRQAGGCARCGGPDWKRSRWRAYGRRDADDLRTAWRKLCCANCVPSPALYSPARRMRERIGRPFPFILSLESCFPREEESARSIASLPRYVMYDRPEREKPFIGRLRSFCELLFSSLLNLPPR